nr:MAG: hypothetical protein [Chemarfal virus 165]
MSKSKYKNDRKKNRTPKSSKRTLSVRPRMASAITRGMDTLALKYIQLLKDPCSAPLAWSVSPLSGSFISRYAAEYVYTNSSGVARDFAFQLAPGDWMGASAQAGFLTGENATVGDPLTFTGRMLPGRATLAGYASSAKLIAACVDVRWGGTELNRAGIVGKYTSGGKLVEFGDTPYATDLLANCFKVERMPDHGLTLRWRPNAHGDQQTQDPGVFIALKGTDKSSFGIVIPSLAAAQSISYRVTTVYEWTPIMTAGQPIAPYTERSIVPYQSVVHALDTDHGWLDRISHYADLAGRAFKTGKTVMAAGTEGLSFANTLAPLLF